MTKVLTSIHGKRVGLDADDYLTTETGIKVPRVYVGASGSEIEAIGTSGELKHPVTAATTGTTIPNFGIATVASTSGTKALTMAAPAAGVEKEIYCTAASTANKVTVTLASGTFDGTNNVATFDAAGENLIVTGLSTARYGIKSNVGSVALSTS